MVILVAFILFLIGVSFGSFLNVVADRVPQRKSIVSPPSHCFQCGHPLKASDMVPVISYIVLRGKCHYCGAIIPARSMLVELFTGLIFGLAWVVIGLQWQLLIVLIYICILVVLSITDMESGFLPGLIIYPALGIALVIAFFKTFTGLAPDIVDSALGFAASFGFFLILWGIPRLFKKQAFGFGDVLMGGLIGIMLGFPLVVAAIYIAILTGGLTTIALLMLKVKKLTDPVPFAIFLALGAAVALIWGREITMLIITII